MAELSVRDLIERLSPSVGIEAAEKFVYEAVDEVNLPRKTLYTKEEFQKICEALKKRGGYIKIIATIASTSV